jgi:hypothetical protein
MDIESYKPLSSHFDWLPEMARQFPFILLTFALILSVEARADTHGQVSPKNIVDGIWDVEDEGSVKIDAMTLTINRQFASLGKRTKNTPLVTVGLVRHKGDSHFQKFGKFHLAVSDDGTITMSHGQFGYCNCGAIDYTMRATGDPDVMIGEWVYKDDERGTSIWRRRPPITIESVSYVLRHSYKNQRYLRDTVAYGERPLNVTDWPKAYQRSIWLTVSGRGLAGGHDVWLDPSSKLKLRDRRWRCQDNRTREGGDGWTSCGNWGKPDLGVVALVLEIKIPKNTTAGIKTLWIDDQPVHFYVHAINEPEEPNQPKLVMLDAVNMQGEQITQVEESVPFLVKAIYDGEHPEEWISITMPTLRRADEEGAPQQIVLRRTDDPRIFQSDWLAIEDGAKIKASPDKGEVE